MNATTTTLLPIVEPPGLDHDAMMLARFGQKLNARMRTERKLIWNLLAHLDARGFKVCGLSDGDDRTKLTDPKAAMELIFDLDECWLYVRKDHDKAHTLFIVLGNDGWDAINDHSIGDEDGFTAAMDSFDVEQFA